jgi:hypothetical protein
MVRVPRRVFQRLLPERPTPERLSKPIIYSEPGSRASPSGSSADASWARTGMSRSADGICARSQVYRADGERLRSDPKQSLMADNRDGKKCPKAAFNEFRLNQPSRAGKSLGSL